MDVVIEDASARQLNALYEVEKRCFEEEAFSKQQIGYLLANYNALGLVARVEGEIVGFVIGQVEDDETPYGHILTLDVLPVCRRRGIAQRLLQEMETLFRARDIQECRLEVRVDNAAALALYQKLGYERVTQLKNYYRTAHGWYLKKSLL